jgi:hypothetical protein
MRCSRPVSWSLPGLLLLLGCSNPPGPPAPPKPTDEQQIRDTFARLQAALEQHRKTGDQAEVIWEFLAPDTQADARREAKAIRTRYVAADKNEKATMQEKLGLSEEELPSLKGPGLLRSKLFPGKYDELVGSRVEKVTLKGEEEASLRYVEDDGDKVDLRFVRDDGRWKAVLGIEKFR